jgi:lactate permease
VLTICSVLAFAYICTYSGMSSTLGLAFASTGAVFPLFSPVLGWLGVFLTGSVVNSGSLFAPLQSVTASQIGIAPETMVAVNVMGGTMAKMISPQSIAVAAAAVGIAGKESELFKVTIKYSLGLLVVIGIISWLIF